MGRNLVNAEIVDDTAEFFLEIYKSILNSNTNQPLNYFWLSQSCSPSLSTTNCPPDYINSFNRNANGIALPTLTFFQDTGEIWESYCHTFTSRGTDTTSSNCFGRSAAPVCSVHAKNSPSFLYPGRHTSRQLTDFIATFSYIQIFLHLIISLSHMV